VRLTLNRPAQFNSLSEEMLAALGTALERIAQDASARVVVLAGAGKAFCAGHDLKQMKARQEGWLSWVGRIFTLSISPNS
jgi:enoyl-CoA hydratase/carnithine racemase